MVNPLGFLAMMAQTKWISSIRPLKHVGGFKYALAFELMDLIGVDINLNATKGVYESLGIILDLRHTLIK